MGTIMYTVYQVWYTHTIGLIIMIREACTRRIVLFSKMVSLKRSCEFPKTTRTLMSERLGITKKTLLEPPNSRTQKKNQLSKLEEIYSSWNSYISSLPSSYFTQELLLEKISLSKEKAKKISHSKMGPLAKPF